MNFQPAEAAFRFRPDPSEAKPGLLHPSMSFSHQTRPPLAIVPSSGAQRENRELATEIKFLLPRAVAPHLREWAQANLAPDPHADDEGSDSYAISSLYFDTPEFDVFHRRGSYQRSKYRIRRYGNGTVVFLERKLKTHGLVSKRRTPVAMDILPKLALPSADGPWPGTWYHQRLLLRRLRPVCEIGYRRNARVAMSAQGPIRMTLDDNVRAVLAPDLALRGSSTGARVCADHIILELKYRIALPALFKQLVEQFALTPRAVSKYRLAALALGLVTETESSQTDGAAERSGTAALPQQQGETRPNA